jgi:hypothetical protein
LLRNVHLWLPNYLKRHFLKNFGEQSNKIYKILFCICDHFEPFWNGADLSVAYKRVKTWVNNFPEISLSHKDFMGNHPRHAFFYPFEEYNKNLVKIIDELCHNGFGEMEIHLHHDNDTADNLKNNLISFKKILSEEHGLLSYSKSDNDVKYAFIHGNWALDNSRPDGRWCGVNNEISILEETGCYADFTMPSAPSDTQTKTINSIYYAIDDPDKPKSHDTGNRARAGLSGQKGLLCIQGPLSLNYWSRKYGILPRIENGSLTEDIQICKNRVNAWLRQHIHVEGRRDIIFVKVYTHGTQEAIMDSFFREGELNRLFSILEEICSDTKKYRLHYVTPRQMYNVVKGLEAEPEADVSNLLDSELILRDSH